MEYTKQERILSIFFRALRGEELSVRRLADEYGTSAKSITRDINDIKAFFRISGSWREMWIWYIPIRENAII